MPFPKKCFIKYGFVFIFLLISPIFGQMNAFAADLLVDLVRVRDRSHFEYRPMEFNDGTIKKTVYANLNEPVLDISGVVSLSLYHEPWSDKYGFYVTMDKSSVTKLKKLIAEDPFQLVGVIINDRLCMVSPANQAMRRERFKTAALYTKNEANEVIKAFLALGQEGVRFQNFAIIITALFIFVGSSGFALLGVSIVRTRVTRRRKAHIEKIENRKKLQNPK